MNTETRFTPGPWTARRNPDGNNCDELMWDIFADEAKAGQKLPAQASNESNAHLIEGAPDMYAALKDAREYVMELLSIRNLQSAGYTMHGQIRIIEGCLENIDAALAKAEGKA